MYIFNKKLVGSGWLVAFVTDAGCFGDIPEHAICLKRLPDNRQMNFDYNITIDAEPEQER